ncbi:hypothetical protein AQUCO_00700616v1 [Aquilegia coerulea]|uniref:Cyclin-dependent kinase inhibitor domain-containing protein n=1 Tax=Aquilegia coerulea TaxID=218851 RepID=A0A2G5EL04_AQUCA|nr:hypothetical protein AQUCO_00700616v1 [Aquilegia coerulea]
MGRLMRKQERIGEVAVMEVSHHQLGVRTRARTLAMALAEQQASSKTRKVSASSQHFDPNSSCIQLRSRKIMENSISQTKSSSENICSSSSSSDHVLLASRCSSNGSSEILNDKLRSFIDLDQDKSHEFENCSPYTERKEKTSSSSSEIQCSQSNDMESTGRQTEADSRHKCMAEKMPTDAELEDFFSAAEKDEKKRFEEKYNYDIVKDVPLEGRFEWVELKNEE